MKVARTVLRGAGAGNSLRLPGSRHEVAFIDCLAKPCEAFDQTRRSSAGILGERAAHGASMAVRSLPDNVPNLDLFREGWKPRGGHPPGSLTRVRARI